MNIPAATYRIQFRNGMTFDRAAALVPYFKALGISHLYASPIFTALSGSTHGYDVTDANEIDPAIGGRQGFERMVKALKDAGLGLILDIVPNHMASSLENAWWRDVVEYGEKSRYARYFDIDWSRRLTLPFLGDDFATELENGAITVRPDPQTGKPALAYYETFYPLTPDSWQGREEEVLQLTDSAKIAELHEQQPYQLMSWRDAPRDLSYRRFFEITGLAGVRVEDEAVFNDAHRLALELVHSGAVDGLRLDHVDGLADPKGYLERLRQAVGPNCYLTVEKILAKDEQLPADWPVSGTTGYEFIATLAEALVDGDKIRTLRKTYEEILGKPVDVDAELRAAKMLMATRNFAGEANRLLQLALSIARRDNENTDEKALLSALRELLVAFPVYRTYGTAEGLPAADADLLLKVVEKVQTADRETLGFLTRVLAGEVSAAAQQEAAVFRTRFQQLTGPLMAKSVEDTLFFRLHLALALNEVGAEPMPDTFSLARFHAEMQTRLERQPDGLSGTTTHDTKRGEDARARLYTLTEAPEKWAEHVNRWRQMNHVKVMKLTDGPAPKPAVEWMLYQALAGVWPPQLQPDDAAGLKALEERFLGFVEKALREAKLRTDWADSNEIYENAVLDYVRHLLSPENKAFLLDFTSALQPFIHAGLVNSLAQTAIKLTAPGVPDIYQGSETLDFSLVDPDNRREPDFAALEKLLQDTASVDFSREEHWLDGRLKQHLIASVLPLRHQQPELFRKGAYLPLTVSGIRAKNVVAYARTGDDAALIVITPRLVLDLMQQGHWKDTDIALPSQLAHRRYYNVLSGEELALESSINLNGLDCRSPLILLSR
ncbi:malto-oligosyltrehalose synthase [Erwinia phyllosphaerae]|uniref:malto-oligosyltrehalose synthase n=1 Tax=Erwinia phyllosphaerae TaxID=2853256 RepID=UPI001FEECF0A|nr:malto-oligosyltrehalose synthase [Erwinia phyllosphaerae]